MRKLILISALLLASASAHAGESRGLVLAANDTPAATDTATPDTGNAPLPPKSDAAKSDAAKSDDTPAAQPQTAAKPQASRPTKSARAAHHYEGDEAKARRIAAKYGVYW